MCAIHKCPTKRINQRIRRSNTNLLMRCKQSPSEQKQIAVGVWKDPDARRYRQGLCSASQLAGCVWQLLSPRHLKPPDQQVIKRAWIGTVTLIEESTAPRWVEWSWPWMQERKRKGADMIRVRLLMKPENTCVRHLSYDLRQISPPQVRLSW